MDDRALYQAILGLEAPWQVDQVELRMEPGEVEVWVAAATETSFACPDCAAPSPIHDHVERRWPKSAICWLPVPPRLARSLSVMSRDRALAQRSSLTVQAPERAAKLP